MWPYCVQKGVTALKKGNISYALQQMQAILEKPGADAKRRERTHFNMACIFDELRRPLDAGVSMSAALALDQNDHHAVSYRAHLYCELGDCSRAEQVSL